MISSYPSIYNIGHRAVRDLFTVPVIVEEKVDGSQISFQMGTDGVLRMRSKGAELSIEAPAQMFTRGVDFVKSIADRLVPGMTYRGEYLSKPKHNVLCYDRVPNGHIILYDINRPGDGSDFLSWEEKHAEAKRLGMDVVPILTGSSSQGGIDGMTAEKLRACLDTVSVLGGQKIEGVVVKPRDYNLFGVDKKVLFGKFVSESFKESHKKEWKSSDSSVDILSRLVDELKTPARWNKAIIHLREQGLITDSPKDIGLLIKEVQSDVESDSMDRVTEVLVAWAWPQIKKRLTGGLAEWYKEQLLESQFEENNHVEPVASADS